MFLIGLLCLSNNGIALEHARKRIAIAPTFEARSELVELLRRVGDHPGELLAGQELLVEIVADQKYDQARKTLTSPHFEDRLRKSRITDKAQA